MLHCEAMTDVLISKYGSSQIAHDLVYLDQDASRIFRVEGNWLNMRVNLAPLLIPISADGLLALNEAAFERSWPNYVGSHQDEGCVGVSGVECRIGCAKQFDFWCRFICHHI